MRYAVDFDKTLADGRVLRLGAAAMIRGMKSAGHYLVLHSCRLTPPHARVRFEGRSEPDAKDWELYYKGYTEMRDLLTQAGIWEAFDCVWTYPGKPDVDAFLDDRAFPVKSWRDLV